MPLHIVGRAREKVAEIQAIGSLDQAGAIAAENGFRGAHVKLLEAVAAEAERSLERHLPVNVSGAIGAIASELGLDWRVSRGIGLIARTIGLVAHLLEEIRSPLARELWLRTEHEAQTPP